MKENAEIIPISFDEKFLNDYANRLVKDPEVAIVELVSNCSDAGANIVEIDWPTKQNGDFSIRDDGTGMTYDEFVKIWNTLSYNRREHRNDIEFPSGNERSNRKLFGRNGKGRFGLFCFDDEYTVETSKGGKRCVFKVCRQAERRADPIKIEVIERIDDDEATHKTIISCCAFRKHISVDRLIDLIQCKFIADPSLKISINGNLIELTDLSGTNKETVATPLGEVNIFTFDSGRAGRTSRLHGVAWHVHNKAVGEVGWRDPNRMYTLDARTAEAKQYTFVVVADILADYVDSDWTGFLECNESIGVLEIVSKHIQVKLDELFYEKRQERKRVALQENKDQLKDLPRLSYNRIGTYVDGIQSEVRTINQKTLNASVKLLANMEEARTGYNLLYQLADVSPDEVDKLSEILEKWSICDAEIVLEELGRRLNLIKKLEELVDKDVDELHVIHPLIEQGLWIFGPEYEGVSFTSNKGLRTVFRDLLGDTKTFLDQPRLRPDIVAVPEVFSRDSYGENGEVNGLEKVLIIELKRGGSNIRLTEMRKVEDYAREISKSGHLVSTGKIVGFLIGSTLEDGTDEPLKVGDREHIRIEARTYQTVIRQAKARTFHLKRRIEEARFAT